MAAGWPGGVVKDVVLYSIRMPLQELATSCCFLQERESQDAGGDSWQGQEIHNHQTEAK